MEHRARQGILLKQTRESKGISLETIHESTKVPLDALRAIEEGYTIRTLNEFYYRGFIKIYAEFLGLDLRKVFDDYHPEQLPKKVSERGDKKEPFAEKVSAFLMTGIFQQAARWIIILLVLTLVFKMGGCVIRKFSRKDRPAKSAPTQVVKKETPKRTETVKLPTTPSKKTSQKTEVKAQAPESKPATPAVSTVRTLGPTTVAKKLISLSVRANRKCWLRVEADGEVVFQSILKRGAVETWEADQKIEISGKHISELEFELNGKLIGTLGRKDRRAKKVVFTKGGFSVAQ